MLTDGAVLDDIDGTIQTLTISITNISDGALERLSHTRNGNIGSIYTADTGSLTLVAGDSATNADFEQVLNSVTYENTSLTPDTTRREITFVANDGEIDSSVATAFVSLSGDAIAPVLVNNSGGVVNEGETLSITSGELQFFDAQGAASINYSVTAVPANGFLALSSDATTPATSFTQEDIDLGNLIYVHSGSETTSDQFVFTVDDGQGNSDSGQFDIVVNAVNDAPNLTLSRISVDEGSANNTLTNEELIGTDVDDASADLTYRLISTPSEGLLGFNNGGIRVVLNVNDTFTQADVDSGNIFYTHSGSEAPTDSFDLEFYDGGEDGAATRSGTFEIAVNQVNDAPIAVNDDFTVTEDGTLTTTLGVDDLLQNDSDPDGDTLTVNMTPVSGPANGSLTLGTDGTFTYTPNADFNGVDSFSYQVSDANGRTAEAIVEITVDPINDDPVAVDDLDYTTPEDTSLIISVSDLLANDSDVDGDALEITSASATNGTITFNVEGTLTYTPDTDFSGIESVRYLIRDGNGGTAEAIVEINVTPVNDAPTITPVTLVPIVEDSGATTITQNDLLAGANDVDGDTLSAIGLTITSGSGTLVDNLDGTWDFTPDANDDSNISFRYDVTDGNATVANTATLDITPVNDAPVAADDSFTTSEDSSLSISTSDLLANDSDVDGDTLTVNFTPISGPANGTLSVNGVGSFSYTPDADFNGTDSFIYEVSDADGLVARATVVITVTAVNDAPVLPNDRTVSVSENTTLVGTFAGVDPDGDTITYSLVGDDEGLFIIDSSTGEVTFASAPNFETPLDVDGDNAYEITVVATDDGTGALTNRQNIRVIVTDSDEFAVTEPVDSDATANQVVENAAEGTSVGLTAQAVDLDATNNTITYTLTSNPDNLFQIDVNTGEVTTLGSIDRETHGAVRSITVEAASSDGSTATASFDIVIDDANELAVGPVTDVDNAVNAVDENAAVGTVVGIVANATDADATNNTVAYSLSNNDGGRFQIDAVTGQITVAGNIDFETDGATRNIVVRAEGSDGSFSEQMFTVAINDVNEAPTVSLAGVVFSLPEGVDTTGGVRIADILVSDDALGTNTLSLSGIDAGVFEIIGNELRLRSGTNLDFESLSQYDVNVEVNDQNLEANPNDAVSHTLNVTDVDDVAPVIDAGQQFVISANSSGGTNVGIVTATDADTVDPLVNWTIVGGNESGNFTINSSTGVISIAENADLDFYDVATYELLIVVSDGNQNSAPESVAVNLFTNNSAPVAQNDSFQVSQFDSVMVSGQGVLSNDSDSDGDGLTAQLVSPPDNGDVTLNPDGSLVYTPNGSFVGVDSFTYQVFDGAVAGTIATVEIVVNPLGVSGNDPGSSNEGTSSNEPSGENESNESEEMIDSGDSSESTMVSADSPSNSVVISSNNDTGVVGSNRLNNETSNPATQIDSEVSIDEEIVLEEDASDDLVADLNPTSASQERIELRFDHLQRAAARTAANEAAPVVNLPLSVVLPGQTSGSEESAEQKLEEIVSGTYVVSTATFSVGYVLWMIRGGSLLASFSSTLPAWTSLDPLAIVAIDGDDEEDVEDNESLIEIANANFSK